jgi:hypothetical protein
MKRDWVELFMVVGLVITTLSYAVGALWLMFS